MRNSVSLPTIILEMFPQALFKSGTNVRAGFFVQASGLKTDSDNADNPVDITQSSSINIAAFFKVLFVVN